MRSAELLTHLHNRGIEVILEGDRLRFKAPTGTLTSDLREELSENKTALLEHLRSQVAVDTSASASTPTATAPDIAFECRKKALEQADDWQAIEAVLEDVQAAFMAGTLSQEEAESLGQIAMQVARTRPETATDESSPRLSDLFRDSPVRRVWSAVLDGEVLCLADGAEEPADNTLVVYRQSELQHLVGMAPEQLKAVHLTKTMLDGDVIDAYEERSAIMEHDGGLPRDEAERQAAEAHGLKRQPAAAKRTA